MIIYSVIWFWQIFSKGLQDQKISDQKINFGTSGFVEPFLCIETLYLHYRYIFRFTVLALSAPKAYSKFEILIIKLFIK